MILAPVGFALTNNINSMTAAHFVLWPAILANGAIRLFAGSETILSGPNTLLSGPAIVLVARLRRFPGVARPRLPDHGRRVQAVGARARYFG